MVYVSSFCCCVGLEKGSTIISVMQIIAGTIAMVCKAYISAELRKQMVADDDPNWTYYKLSVAAAVASALHVIFGFILYSGVRRKHIKCLGSWICFMILALTFSLIFLIIIVVSSISAGAVVGEIVGKFFFGFIIVAFEAYFVAVVYSFFQMVKSDDSMNGY